MAFYIQSINKEFNRNKILQLIFRHGPISRASIAEDNYLTPATVTTNVAALISQGVVEDIGEVECMDESTLGRKRVLVDIVGNYAFSIGCEITEKFISFCIINLKGNIEHSTHFVPTFSEIQNINHIIIKNINALIEKSLIPREKIVGIGIALPGHYDLPNDQLISNLSIWNNFSLQELQTALAFEIVCENNVRCMACGEYFFNKENSPESFNFFHLGRGMFSANIINGELFIGTNFLSGEIGHTIVQPNGTPCECGKYGCLQTYCSETWLIKKCKLIYENLNNCILRQLVPNANEITISQIILAYQMGDALVCNLISDMINYLSITISNIMIINNPSKILFHSEIFESQSIKKRLLSAISHQLDFIDNDLCNTFEVLPYSINKGAIGAAALAISTFFISKKMDKGSIM